MRWMGGRKGRWRGEGQAGVGDGGGGGGGGGGRVSTGEIDMAFNHLRCELLNDAEMDKAKASYDEISYLD